MYSSRGTGNSYGQSGYGQNLATGYSGGSAGGPDGGPQRSLVPQHSSIRGSLQEADMGSYRSHASAAHYGGQYGSVYVSGALSGAQQLPAISSKGAGSSVLEARSAYAAIADSPKFTSSDYVSSSSHGYGHKTDSLYAEKVSDYPSIERRQYIERHSAYIGRDLQTEPTGRFSDSVGFDHQHQADIYDRIDRSLLRQEQLLKAQSLQSAVLDGSTRQTDYLAARAAASRPNPQDLYGGRMDSDPRSLSVLSASSYGGQNAPLLGTIPRRNVDDLVYAQASSNPGYGVSLPPGRDYSSGKGLHEPEYSSIILRGSHSGIEERKDDRAGYLRDFELREEERRRERLRERELDREREKERERERERERDREREHDRERARERERLLERREKERERDRKHGLEVRRERTPPRASRERRGSSLIKDIKSLRRDSPRREASHRRQSPVREIRREYVCKVYSSSLVAVERDYLSIDRRYPRLFISPYLSKVIVNWPKESLKLSIRTAVSFEHDFVEDESAALPKTSSAKVSAEDSAMLEQRDIIWNAKVILMSGVSRSAIKDLSSDESFKDRVPHICNILKFAVLKKDDSLMAIGGPWSPVDGSDPSVDESSLIKTALRYTKELTQLDLNMCVCWNRFLEIHYDRIGPDGLFCHKEVTVLFVPDLSDCLPSLEKWRDQWLVYKNSVAERELKTKKEKAGGRKEVQKGKDVDSPKDSKTVGQSEKKNKSASSGQLSNTKRKAGDASTTKGRETEEKGAEHETKDKVKTSESVQEAEGKEQGGSKKDDQAVEVKSGKKKVLRKIVKPKGAAKTTGVKNSDGKDEIGVGEDKAEVDTMGKQDVSSAKTETAGTQSEVKTQMEIKGNEAEADDDGSNGTAVAQDGGKKIIKKKKKIIRRVVKKKVVDGEGAGGSTGSKNDGDGRTAAEREDTAMPTAVVENHAAEVSNLENKDVPNFKHEASTSEKLESRIIHNKEDKSDNGSKEDEKGADRKGGLSDKPEMEENQNPLQKDNASGKKLKEVEKSKDDKKRKDTHGKSDQKETTKEEMKGKAKLDDPPRPGFILQTRSKDAKLRSLSFSLDSFLDYTTKDTDESTFELSLFAESFYEMLQYEMGCRILAFLQKLRPQFLMKRNQCKRRREETDEKGNEKMPSSKVLKTSELPVKGKVAELEKLDAGQVDEKKMEEIPTGSTDNKMNEESYDAEEDPEEEDPEEDPEEYEMEDTTSQHDSPNKKEKPDVNGQEKNVGVEGSKVKESAEETNETLAVKKLNANVDNSGKSKNKVESETKQYSGLKEDVVNKELLQAFRFFDRNRVGYIRVEDMRLIIHSLGKFLSHRDVKELVQSALLESNTGRDDRIIYDKLVRMTNL